VLLLGEPAEFGAVFQLMKYASAFVLDVAKDWCNMYKHSISMLGQAKFDMVEGMNMSTNFLWNVVVVVIVVVVTTIEAIFW